MRKWSWARPTRRRVIFPQRKRSSAFSGDRPLYSCCPGSLYILLLLLNRSIKAGLGILFRMLTRCRTHRRWSINLPYGWKRVLGQHSGYSRTRASTRCPTSSEKTRQEREDVLGREGDVSPERIAWINHAPIINRKPPRTLSRRRFITCYLKTCRRRRERHGCLPI